MQTNTNNNRKSIVTYCLITENTGQGIRMSKWCLLTEQFNRIKRKGKVIIKSLSKDEYKALNIKNIVAS